MWQADSVIALLGKLDVERLPPHEGRAVGEVQAKAVDEWLAAYISAPDEMLAKGDAVATALYQKYKRIGMPNLKLGASDVADLVAFLTHAKR